MNQENFNLSLVPLVYTSPFECAENIPRKNVDRIFKWFEYIKGKYVFSF